MSGLLSVSVALSIGDFRLGASSLSTTESLRSSNDGQILVNRDGSYSIHSEFPDRGIVDLDAERLTVASSDRNPVNYNAFMDFAESDRSVYEAAQRVELSLHIDFCVSRFETIDLSVVVFRDAWNESSFRNSNTPALTNIFSELPIELSRVPSGYEIRNSDISIDLSSAAKYWSANDNHGVLLFVADGGPGNLRHPYCSFESVESGNGPVLELIGRQGVYLPRLQNAEIILRED